jgi:hypothetical protein
MLKSITFGLLAAALTIVPTTAFAGQFQENNQVSTQEGAALNGSINTQTNVNSNNQRQSSDRSVVGRRPRVGGTSQGQRSNQDNLQSGAAENGSINNQRNRNENNQRQVENVRVRSHR